MDETLKTLKTLNGALEVVLGIPVIGGTIIMGSAYLPLLLMLILHTVALVLCLSRKQPMQGAVLGVITSCIAWIPIVGMVLHLITGVANLREAYGVAPSGNQSVSVHVINNNERGREGVE